MVKKGEQITRRISMRTWGNNRDRFVKLYDSVKHENEDLVSSRVIDADTIEIITVAKKEFRL